MKRRSFPVKYIAVALVLLTGILITVVFVPNFSKLYELEKHYSAVSDKLILEEKRNLYLKEEFDGLSNNPDYIEKVAREKLGWCRSSETVYRFPNTPVPGSE